jgi:hypothetical protein
LFTILASVLSPRSPRKNELAFPKQSPATKLKSRNRLLRIYLWQIEFPVPRTKKPQVYSVGEPTPLSNQEDAAAESAESRHAGNTSRNSGLFSLFRTRRMTNRLEKRWSRGPDLNRGPVDYESTALPTELPRPSAIHSSIAWKIVSNACAGM